MSREQSQKGPDGITRVERELDRIFSNLGHGMYVVDNDRRVLLWNRSAESILGWTEKEALGKGCREFIGHQDDEGNQLCDTDCPLIATMGESHTIFAGTVWAQSKGEELIPVNVSCAPILDDDGNVVGAVEVFADMTREKEVDRLKSDMVSVVAHELRTPLTSMRGYLELVLTGDAGEITGEQKNFLEIVDSNVQRLKELVDDFLDVDKLESGRMQMHWEELDVKRLIEEAVETFKPQVQEKSLKLITQIEEAPAVTGDRQLFQQVVSNLISNAIKYTNEGEVGVRSGWDGERVFIEVWDTGVGIPEDEIGKLGEKFYRASTAAKTPSHGSGLGLSITYEIIRKHDGELRIESTEGKGSKFGVYLPQARERTIIRNQGEAPHE